MDAFDLTEFNHYKARRLRLNMARGKPNPAQLALSAEMLHTLSIDDCFSEDGTDCRNYGGVDGIPEMRRIFAEMLDVDADEVIVGGNASLNMMFDCVSYFMQHGTGGKHAPWAAQGGRVKFICPAPGYDRHFAICAFFDMEMIPVAMTPDGPDMDAVEALLASDPMIKGMWCVPVFSNPQGYVYADETIRRLAKMTAAPDFRLFWDNAYAVHHFNGERPNPLSVLRACEASGNAERPLIFTSFSKISFAGSAVAAVAASRQNLAHLRKRIAAQTVGPDKMNQLRHARFFKNLDGVLTHMAKQAAILRPKFALAHDILTAQLAGKGIASWHCPNGGYFMALDTLPGCAKRTVALCREAGVALTEAGATFPYKTDPFDRNIRIAPSYPDLSELQDAMHVFCLAVRIAAAEAHAGEAHAAEARL